MDPVWHCLIVSLFLRGHQYISKHLHVDHRNSRLSAEMNWTEWTSFMGDRLQCSEWDTICSCNYYTTLHIAQRRQRVNLRPFDIYNCSFSAGALDRPSPPPSDLQKMELGDISVFLNEPLRGWYFANHDHVDDTETSWLSVDACTSPHELSTKLK